VAERHDGGAQGAQDLDGTGDRPALRGVLHQDPKAEKEFREIHHGHPTRKAWISSVRNFVLVGARHAFPLLRPEHHLIIKDLGGVGAPLLMEALPESRMILLVRDPRDIVASWRAAASEGGWKRRSRRASSKRGVPKKKRPEDVRKLAKNYRKNLTLAKQAYDAHRGPKTLVLYEELRVDTLGVMKRLYSDLGIEVDETQLARAVKKHAWENIPEDMKGEGTFYRKASPGGWREDLTPEQAEIVERITAPVLAEFYSQRPVR
jgi:Sulfotransferase domain